MKNPLGNFTRIYAKETTLNLSFNSINFQLMKLRTLLLLVVVFGCGSVWSQNSSANFTGTTTGAAWYTTGNWSTSLFAGVKATATSNSNIATFISTSAGSAGVVGINMNTSSLSLGAISIDNTRTNPLLIGNSSTALAGTLALYGATVNSIPNVIIRNNGTGLLTLQASQSGTMGVVLSNATDNIINIDNSGGILISAIISGGTNSLSVGGTGSGALTLSGANTYTGNTTINSGSLLLGASNVIANTSNIVLNGGTFKTGSTTGFTDIVGTLNLNANATIALGTGNHSITFANSSAVTWAGNTLTITGWTGTAGATGTAGKIFAGNSNTGLTASQLAKINFNGYTAGGQILSTGEIVPASIIAPTLTTTTASAITTSAAASGGNITANGGSAITAEGVVWNTAATPTIALATKTSDGTATGSFSSSITGLAPNTKYFYRAYASNSTVTGYGSESNFTTIHNAPTVGSGSGATINAIVANWSAPTGGGTEAFTYEIQVADNTGFSPTSFTSSGIASSSTAITATGLAASTTYYYRVRAVNAGGNSAWSATSAGYLTLDASTPSIIISGTLSALTTTYGTASGTTNFTASGSSLTNDITINAPTGFEISTTAGSGYNTSLILAQSSGTVATTTIYVRLAAATVPGSYSGNVALTSTGATTVNIATASSTVTAKALTISGIAAVSKEYDRLTTTTLSGTAVLNGIVGSDVVTLSGTPAANFATAGIGTSKPVTVTGYALSGTNAANYTLTQPTGFIANITAKPLTIVTAAASNKTYNGTTTATLTGTLSGVISPDVVTLALTGTFASANVSAGIAVTSTSTLGGAGAGNYTLTQPTGLIADITQASQTITFGALASQNVGAANFTLTATASSGLAVTYISSNPAVATVSGSTVTIVGAGTSVITASQAGNTNYAAAASVNQNQLVVTGPCLSEDFSSGSIPSGWLSSSTSITYGSGYADMSVVTATLATVSVANPASLAFNLSRTTNTTVKNLDVEISTTSQTSGFTVVQSFDHSNTTSGGTTACTVNLSAYTAYSTVYIRFNKTSGSTSPWRIDDIAVTCGTACTPPATSATALTINSATPSSLGLNFTRGNGDGVIIVAKSGSAATGPTAGTVYNLGDAIGGGTVVYKGTASGASTAATQTIASLTEGTLYYFSIYEYNSATNCYQATALTANAYTLSTEPTGHSTFTNTVISSSQINLSFPTTSASLGADGFVILRRGDGTSPTITGITDGVAPLSWTLPSGTTLVTTTTSGTTYNNTGLTGATNYCYLLVPYNWNASNATTYNYYTSGTVPTTCGTTPTAPTASSDIITDSSYAYSTNINYLNWQSASITNVSSSTNGSIGVQKITIRDGGASASDADTFPTILNAITFSYAGTANTIKSAALFTSTNALIATSVTAGANTITFPTLSGANVTAPDDGSISLILRVTFNNTVTDNDKLVFTVTSATAAGGSTSSLFAAANAGGAISDNSADDKNRLEVTADRLAFVQQPTNTSINGTMSPSVTIAATDLNGNTDADYTTDVTITSSGFLTGSPISIPPIAGLSTFSSLVHTAAATGRQLTASASGLTGISSTLFDILTITYTSGDYRTNPLLTSGTVYFNSAAAIGGIRPWQKWNGSSWDDITVSTDSPQSLTTKPDNIYIVSGGYIDLAGGATYNNIIIDLPSASTIVYTGSSSPGISITAGKTVDIKKGTLDISSFFELLGNSQLIVRENSSLYISSNLFTRSSTSVFEVENNGYVEIEGKWSAPSTSIWNGSEIFHENSWINITNWNTAAKLFDSGAISATTVSGYSALFGRLSLSIPSGALTSNWTVFPQSVSVNLTHHNFEASNGDTNNMNFYSGNTSTMTIGGDFTANVTSTGKIQVQTGVGSLTINTKGNFTKNGSGDFIFQVSNNAANVMNLNVDGNFTVNNGNFYMDSGSTSGATTKINLKGNLKKLAAGKMLNSNTNSSNISFNFIGTSLQTTDLAVNAASDMLNYKFFVKAGASVQTINQDWKLATNSAITVESTGTFDFGLDSTTALNVTETTSSAITSFILNSGGTLRITSPLGITTSGATGNVQTDTRTYTPDLSVFQYIGKANQVTGNGITSAANTKTIISDLDTNSLQLSFSNSTSITTPGVLDIRKGQVIETPAAYMTGSTGGLNMSANTLYQIAALSSSATDYIPRMTGISNSYNLSGGTIELNGAGLQVLRGSRSYRNLTFSTSGTKNLSTGTASVTGTVLVSGAAILDVENKTLGGSGTNLTMTNTARYITAGTGVKPDAQEIYTLGTGTTIEFSNVAATLEKIRLSPNYYNIDISGSSTGTDTLTSTVNMQAGAIFTVKNTGTFKHSNTAGFAKGVATAISSANNPSFVFESGSTVEYAGANQIITAFALTPATATYSNLTVSGTGSKTIPATEVLIGNNLTVSTAATQLQIGANQLLTVGNIINAPTSSENIIIANTGNLVQINEGVTNTGRISMARTSRAMSTNDYIYWGSPVTESVALPSSVIVAYMWDLYGTEDGQWHWYSASVPGRGFITRMGGAGACNFDFKGTPTTAQVDVAALNYDAGTNHTGNTILLANPYPSAINAVDFVSSPDNTELKGTLYFWTSFTPVTGGLYTVNDYASWNLTGSTATSDLSNSLGLIPTGKIAAGQGFFAELEASGTVSFHNSMRTRSLTDNTQFFRTANPENGQPEQDRIWLNITNTNGAFRQALVGYVEGATNAYERLYDGNSFTDNETNFYSLAGDKALVIQGRALPFEQADTVPLGIRISTAGTYSIAIDHMDGLFATGQDIYLEDLLLHTINNLKSSAYSFTSETGTFDNRFVLRYTNSTLGTGTFDPATALQVAVNKNILKVRSASEPIGSIAVFDISGRKVYEHKAIGSNEFQASDIVLNHQALIVKTTLANGQVLSRKIVY